MDGGTECTWTYMELQFSPKYANGEIKSFLSRNYKLLFHIITIMSHLT
jgi:hypothetical protein